MDTRNMEAEKWAVELEICHLCHDHSHVPAFDSQGYNTKQTTNGRDLQPQFWNILVPPEINMSLKKRGNYISPTIDFQNKTRGFWGPLSRDTVEGEISCTIAAVSTRAQRTHVANGNRWIMLCCWLAMVPNMDVTGIRVWDTHRFSSQGKGTPPREVEEFRLEQGYF